MSFRSKIRGFLSVFILCLSVAIFIFFCIESNVQARPASSPEILAAPSEAPFSQAEREKPIITPVPTVMPDVEPLPWSLVLVNKDNPLDMDFTFAPALYSGETVDNRMYEEMTKMLNAAASKGFCLWIASSYRDRETQVKILENAIKNRMMDYGITRDEAEADALETIAQPGCSEHQTGLAIDFNYVSPDFEDTGEYEWLQENAENYGFIQRYKREKEDITGITVEAWHYRYVGVEHAKVMNEKNLCLEEYIDYLNIK